MPQPIHASPVEDRRASVRYNGDQLYCGVVIHQGVGDNRPLDASTDKAAEPAVIIDLSEHGLGMIVPFAARKGEKMLLDLAGFGLIVRHAPVDILNVCVISGKLSRVGVRFDWTEHAGQIAYSRILELISLGEKSKAVW